LTRSKAGSSFILTLEYTEKVKNCYEDKSPFNKGLFLFKVRL